MDKDYDFSGWATRNNLKCSDGRTIMQDAFRDNDGHTVPLVWNHQHNESDNVLGHALLQNRQDGVYAYGKFNNTESGQNAKLLVNNGDITALSIYANKLQQDGKNVLHGDIKEVSLVLAGANPGAYIDTIVHGDYDNDCAVFYNPEEGLELTHSKSDDTNDEGDNMDNEKTIGEIFDELNDEQKDAVYAMIGMAQQEAIDEYEESLIDDDDDDEYEEDDDNMKHNAFDDQYNNTFDNCDVLTHAEMTAILDDAKRYGSVKESALAHGITNIEYMFPDAKTIDGVPGFVSRDMEWVKKVLDPAKHSPFSRIKSLFANITEEDARAKGYMKGKEKKDEVFTMLKRTTSPTTIYKKQKMDRDDVVDITNFDVVSWLKQEMRMMLNEELARAVLVGDGRNTSSDDKINEQNVRPIWTDDSLYTIRRLIKATKDSTPSEHAKEFIKEIIRARKDYKGSGNPVLYAPETIITECLLLEDTTGRAIYDDISKLATKMRVSEIVPVPVMEGLKRTDLTLNKEVSLLGILVNMRDYTIGADKGGEVNMFDDFDIDYNAMKYLIETRCSGALTTPHSAIAVELNVATI